MSKWKISSCEIRGTSLQIFSGRHLHTRTLSGWKVTTTWQLSFIRWIYILAYCTLTLWIYLHNLFRATHSDRVTYSRRIDFTSPGVQHPCTLQALTLASMSFPLVMEFIGFEINQFRGQRNFLVSWAGSLPGERFERALPSGNGREVFQFLKLDCIAVPLSTIRW